MTGTNVLGRALRGLVFGRRVAASGLLLLGATSLVAQTPQGETAKEPKAYTPPPIFREAQVMEFTLTAPFKLVKKERSGTSNYRPAEITYAGDSGTVRVPVRVRPRGIWRRKNCDIPPLRLNFKKDSTKKTAFRHVNAIKLAFPCHTNSDEYEQYILEEFQLYRVQRLLTPLSFDARLVRVTYIDAEKKDTVARRYGFLLEEAEAFGARVGGKVVPLTGATGDDLDGPESAMFGLFQYFIGNTDFSVGALHNVALLQRDTSYYPVAYDFDWSGAVNARYATPAPQLPIRRVTDRIMRGYCTQPANYEKAIAVFKAKKDAIYALYHDSVSSVMKPDVVAKTLKYYDEFYEVINDPRLYNRFVIKACLQGQS
jgi:hypothetical protein